MFCFFCSTLIWIKSLKETKVYKGDISQTQLKLYLRVIPFKLCVEII